MADPTRTESPSEAGSIQVVTNQAPDTISAIEGVISNEDAEKQTERLVNLFRTTQDNRICVLHDDRKWQFVAEKILLWYQEKNIACELLVYTKPGWIDEVKVFSHFIFLGLPPYDRGRRGLRLRSPKSPTDGSQMEMSYFLPVPDGGSGGLQINNVVVVIREPINTKHQYKQKVSGHYLEHYLILDGKRKQPSVLAASSLGVFAAPSPQPLQSDKAYWSKYPKLIAEFRPTSTVSLGLIIMTRDMAEGAPFSRIVLINSISREFAYEFYSRVGRYTHIQSINGILLDGLDIEKVTDVFKKVPDHHIQMMVRYVHLGEQDKIGGQGNVPHPDSPLRELPRRQSMISQPDGSRHKPVHQTHSDNETQLLPIPIFILGDNYSLCKELFKVLSDDGPSTPEERKLSLSETPSKNNDSFFAHGTSGKRNLPPSRSVSVPCDTSSKSNNHPPYLFSNSTDNIPEETELQKESETFPVRLRTSSFKGISSSDKYMTRTEVPMSKFENLPAFNESTESIRPSLNTPLSPSGHHHRRDSLPFLPKIQYVLNLPSLDLDRHTTHLYFKTSGIYLVVVGLEDLVENPLCQNENLSYWINLVHTYVSPELKRMFVVGMYKRSMITQRYVLASVKILNRLLATYRQTVRIPFEEQGYVYLFDLENRSSECGFLCSSILNCTRLFCESAFYFAEDVYASIFAPFNKFHKIAMDIALNYDHQIMESKYAMGQRLKGLYGHHHHLHLPPGYFETLSAYSPTRISKHCDGCLLMPSVIPDLLVLCAQMTKYDTQIFDDPALINLPIVSIKMLHRCFKMIQPDGSDFEMIIWWLEHLSIIYSIGRLRMDEKFFIPFLLHHHLSDRTTCHWDEEKVEELFEDATILYAQFSSHVPMTIHLFHKVLAHILSSIVKEGRQHDVYMDPDSPEAVLPLHDDDTDEFLCSVWIKYRAIQNIIEFKAKVTNRFRFLKVVENKLSKAFLGSNYYNRTIDVNRVVSFRIPADILSAETTQKDLWELTQLKSSSDVPEELLVATKHLTEPGNRNKTSNMRRWADKDPEAKELPADLAYKISQRLIPANNWLTLGGRLGLISTDEVALRNVPHLEVDNGTYILQKWRDSNKSFKDLIDGLRELHLESLASSVEEIVYGDDSVPSTPRSRIMEKKLPIDFFLELSIALNIDDKWAHLGGHLKLLRVNDIESLKAKHNVDKGQHVLQLWTDSHLTYIDLINGLRSPRVQLNRYVHHIDEIIKNHLSSA